MIQQQLQFLRADAWATATRFPASARCTNVYAIRTDCVNLPGSLGIGLPVGDEMIDQ